MDKQLLVDLLRNTKGVAETGRAIIQPMIGDIPAGLTGLGSMMIGESMDTAADRTNQVRDQFAYQPSEDADKYLQGIGRAATWAGDKLSKLPGAEQVQQGWEGLTQKAPAVAATVLGVAGVADPTRGGGKATRAAVGATDEVARSAALRAVRDTTERGPAFVSAVDEAIKEMPAKATVGQYVATLRNKPGIKGEEIADLNLAALDPEQVVDRDQFQWIVQTKRPQREKIVKSWDNLDRDALSEKTDEMLRMRISGMASNPRSFDTIRDLFPDDFVHPAEANIAANQQRAAAWTAKAQDDPELQAMALEDLMNSDAPSEARLVAKHLDDPDDEDVLDEVRALADARLDQLRTNPVMWRNWFGDEGYEGMSFDDMHEQYGAKGMNFQPSDELEKQLLKNPGVVERIAREVEADVRDRPGDYSWDSKDLPQYGNMRYYADEGSGGGTYKEILEQQGPMPWARDPRSYSETHWPGRENDITMHLRMDEVKTPEGQRALMLNELQSKYATGVGDRGMTTDPLDITETASLAAKDVERAREVIDNSSMSADEFDAWFENANEAHRWDADFADEVKQLRHERQAGTIDDVDFEERMDELLDTAHMQYSPDQRLDRSMVTHRGQPFSRDNAKTYGDDPAGQGEAAMAVENYQAGGGTGFKGDPRMPPRAGVKSWRLRGLKMALREAADRNLDDLYIPTGQMMPRIEQWHPGIEELDVSVNAKTGERRPASRDEADASARQHMTWNEEEAGMFEPVMKNYDERLPKEWAKYLKQFGAKLEPSEMLPVSGDAAKKATGQRIKFTPELLAEVLRGQKLYQLGGGAALLGLLAAQQEDEQPTL